MRKTVVVLLTYATILALTNSAKAADPIRVMILDGQSGGTYHDWSHVTPVLQKELEEAGLFQVDVVTAPPSNGEIGRAHV